MMQQFADSQSHDCAAPCSFKTGVHDLLRFQRPHRPVAVEFAGENLARKIPDHPRVLRRWMTLRHRVSALRAFWAGTGADFTAVDFKRRPVAVERMDKIRQPQPAVPSADVNPFLEAGQKRAIKPGADVMVKN